MSALLVSVGLLSSVLQPNPRRLTLTPELKLGQTDGPAEYAFGQIGYMAVSPNGNFFLFDLSDNRLRRYEASGRFLSLVGRSGAGPGEYRQILGLAIHSDSLLLVYDPRNARITVFDTSGTYRRSILFQRTGFWGPKVFWVDQAGMLYIRAGLAVPRLRESEPRSQYLKLGLDGTIRDSLPVPSEGATGFPFTLVTGDGARWSFPTQTVFALLSTGELLTASNGRYRFAVNTARFGSHIVELPISPIPITGEERSEWEARARSIAARSNPPHAPTEIPKFKPAFRDIFSDSDGRLWVNIYTRAVKRAVPPRPAGDTRPLLTLREVNVFDLFDLRGNSLGRMELLPNSILMAVQGNRIWVRTEAEGGEYILTRFRVGGLP